MSLAPPAHAVTRTGAGGARAALCLALAALLPLACAGRSPAPPRVNAAKAKDSHDAVLSTSQSAKLMNACYTEDQAMACHVLSVAFEEGVFGYQKNPARADELRARAFTLMRLHCEAGDAEQCDLLGGLASVRLRHLPDGDPKLGELGQKLIPILERACTGGYAHSCGALADLYESGHGAPRDLARAQALYERACEYKDRWSCASLGMKLQREGEAARAAPYFERACAAGEAQSCHFAGYLYFVGEGVAKDLPRAAVLYGKACRGGNAAACTGLGQLYMVGEGMPVEPRRAAALFESACTHDDARGCALLGVLAERGEGVPKDIERARGLYLKSCKAGDEHGCAGLKRLAGPRRSVGFQPTW